MGHQPTLLWDDSSLNTVKHRLAPLLDLHAAKICPPWCRELHLSYSSEANEKGSAMDVNCQYRYRWARISVYPCALDADSALFEKYTVHELFHLTMEPVAHVQHKLLVRHVPNALREYVLEEWEDAMEQSVCDATAAYFESEGRLFPQGGAT